MENEFLAYSVEEDSSCCEFLQQCVPKCRQLCREALSCCYCCCCTGSIGHPSESKQKVQFAHVEYRPLIDSNILTGNTLLHTAGGSFYFPQTHQTLWPEHGSHYKPIKASPVISEQPRGSDHTRRSSRFLAALKQRKRTHTRNVHDKLTHDPTSPLPSLAHSSIEDPQQPTLTLAVMHDIQGSTLTVFLKFASNLNFLLENPYKQLVTATVSAYLLPSKNEILQTSPTNESNNPVYNEKFVFAGVSVSDLSEQTIVFQVYHNRALIGMTRLPLNTADLLGYTVCKHIDRISEFSETEVSPSGCAVQVHM